MTEWHGWIYARKEQEQFLRMFGVTGDMRWVPNEHKEDWVDVNGCKHIVGPYNKVADGYFEQCIVKSTDDMTRLMYHHPAFIAASFTGIDEDGNQLPKEEQTYWSYPPPSIEEFATVFGVIMNVGPYKPTPLERTRAILTDFWAVTKSLPQRTRNLAYITSLRITSYMYVRYLISVCVHKWYVLQECIKLGIPWQGMLHDISKFRPSEFIPYARYFYDLRYGLPEDPRLPDFDLAWLKHQHRNKHHWQHWLLHYDDSTFKILPMPRRHLKEMLADWRGANKAFGSIVSLDEWYKRNAHHIIIGEASRDWLEYKLGIYPSYPYVHDPSPIARLREWLKNRRNK